MMIYLFSVSKKSDSCVDAHMLYGDYFWYNQKIYVFDNVDVFNINIQGGYTVEIDKDICDTEPPFIEENKKIYHDNVKNKAERNHIISEALLKVIIDKI